jgi:hypothetical protein
MVGFNGNWFLGLVIGGNLAFMAMLLFVSVTDAMRRRD